MVITSSTRNRVGGNTPRGLNPTFSAKIKTIHPDGLYFYPKVGFERRLLETCQWHVSTAVEPVGRQPLKYLMVACRSKWNPTAQIQRPLHTEGRRLLAECRRHSATAVGARRPTTSKIFNGCLPQQMESHRPDLSARSIRRERGLSRVPVALCNRREPVGRQPLKYLMVARRRKGNPTAQISAPALYGGMGGFGQSA